MYLKLKLSIFKNGWLKFGKENRLKIFLILFLAVLFALGEYRFFYKIFIYLREEVEVLSKHLTVQLINILNLTFLSMLFFSNLTNAIYYYFVSDDLELLIPLPIKTEKLILYRYLENTFASSWMVLAATIPFFVAILHSFELKWHFIISSVCLYLPYFFLLSALGSLVTLLIVNFFPAKRAYQILWSISALFIATIFVIIRLIRPERLFKKTTETEFMNFLKSLEAPDYPYLPSTWLTKAQSSLIFAKEKGEYSFYLLLLTIAAAICFFIFFGVTRKIYKKCYTRAKTSFKRKGSRSSLLDKIFYKLPVSPVTREFFLKDAKDIVRDTGQWSQMLLLVGLVFVYLFSIKSLPIEKAITVNMVAFFNTGILSFIMAALINRFVFPSFSVEGKVMWVMKSFPVNIKQIFFSKLILYFFPLFIFGTLLSFFSNMLLNVDFFIYIFTLLNVLTITLVLIILALSIGLLYPKFKFSNVTEISFSYGGIIYMLVSMLYIGFGLILQARPVYVYLRNKIFYQAQSYGYFFLFFFVFFIISVIISLYCYNKGVKNYQHWE